MNLKEKYPNLKEYKGKRNYRIEVWFDVDIWEPDAIQTLITEFLNPCDGIIKVKIKSEDMNSI